MEAKPKENRETGSGVAKTGLSLESPGSNGTESEPRLEFHRPEGGSSVGTLQSQCGTSDESGKNERNMDLFSDADSETQRYTPGNNPGHFPHLPSREEAEFRDGLFPKHLVIRSEEFAKKNVFLRSKYIQHAIGVESIGGIRIKMEIDNTTKEKITAVTVETEKQARCL